MVEIRGNPMPGRLVATFTDVTAFRRRAGIDPPNAKPWAASPMSHRGGWPMPVPKADRASRTGTRCAAAVSHEPRPTAQRSAPFYLRPGPRARRATRKRELKDADRRRARFRRNPALQTPAGNLPTPMPAAASAAMRVPHRRCVAEPGGRVPRAGA
ncbi:MAG: hypothetical protein IPK54_07975 [Dokdonella sp.]|nr:hypothetical protein [Dokdonella sp.]